MPETLDRRAGWGITGRPRRTRLKVPTPTNNFVEMFRLSGTECEGQLVIWDWGLRVKGSARYIQNGPIRMGPATSSGMSPMELAILG